MGYLSRNSAQILPKIKSTCTGLTKVAFGTVCSFDGRISLYLESPEEISDLLSLRPGRAVMPVRTATMATQADLREALRTSQSNTYVVRILSFLSPAVFLRMAMQILILL